MLPGITSTAKRVSSTGVLSSIAAVESSLNWKSSTQLSKIKPLKLSPSEMRIFQLTIGDSGDWIADIQALELAMLPIFAGIYSCWFMITVVV